MSQPPGLEEVTCRALFVACQRESEAVRRSQAELATLLPNAAGYDAPSMAHGWPAEDSDLHCHMVRAWVKDEPLRESLVRVAGRHPRAVHEMRL